MVAGRRFSAISLFSGAGGLDVGFQRAGVFPSLSNDSDPDACSTYSLNHKSRLLAGCVTNFMSDFRAVRGIDFVFGGPPCQGFSVAGKMDPRDERSGLIRTFFEVVDLVRPKAFVCENVKALATLPRWSGVRKQLLSRAAREYSIGLLVLNALDYGVPQKRERMFLIGFHKDIVNQNREVLEGFAKDILRNHHAEPPKLVDIVRTFGKAGEPSNRRVCRAKITFAKHPVLRKSAYAGMLFNGAGRPLYPFGPSATLSASMGGNKTHIVDEAVIFEGKMGFVESYHMHLINGGKPYKGTAPENLRRLTVDECAAIQTFPKDYVFSGAQSAVYRQIGNAVPCLMAQAVAETSVAILTGRRMQIRRDAQAA